MNKTSPRLFPSLQSVITICIRQLDGKRRVLFDHKKPDVLQRCTTAEVCREAGGSQVRGLLSSVTGGPEENWSGGDMDTVQRTVKKEGGGIRYPYIK